MTKELQVKTLTRLLAPQAGWGLAGLLAQLLYDTGYRKVGEMPMLTDEEIQREWNGAYTEEALKERARRVAQAQRDADWKAIWGEE